MTQLVNAVPVRGQRAIRRPRHSWYVAVRPFQLQPVLIAPVVAGDSIRGAVFEYRAVSDPVAAQYVGWLGEFFLFYVRMSDLDEFDEVRKLLAGQAASLDTTAKAWTFNAAGYVDWLAMAMKPIVREWFRHERDVEQTFALDGVPVAGIWGSSWLDTAVEADEIGGLTADNYQGRWEVYQEMRDRGLVTGTYEEFLELHGVDVPPQLRTEVTRKRRPELIRFVREYVYPRMATSFSTGLPAAICEWLVRDTVAKPRFCDEPGFVVGIVCFRPKVFRTGQKTTGASLLRDARMWSALSACLADAPQERLLRVPANSTAPIVTGAGVDLWVDVGALATAGDQFFNVSSPPNGMALPASGTGEGRYPVSGTEIDALFSVANGRVFCEGSCALRVSSNIVEAVPT